MSALAGREFATPDQCGASGRDWLGSEQNGKVVNVIDATIRRMQRDDAQVISAAFSATGWNKPVSLYQRYLAEQDDGTRICYVAAVAGQFAGYVTLLWNSKYRPFAVQGIPEISDLNVLPVFRRQGVGSRLLDQAETAAAERSESVGLGVGLYSDYGAAQRIYARRGYLPDSRGMMYGNLPVEPGACIPIDDQATLMLTRGLR